MTRRAPRTERPPTPLLDDQVAYVICTAVNSGYCTCEVSKARACVEMELIASDVLRRIDEHPGLRRRPPPTQPGGLL